MIRIVLVGPFTYFSPEGQNCGLVLIVLHQTVGHIHTESVHTFAVPERDDVLELLTYSLRARLVHTLLPRMVRIRICISVVERRLTGIEVLAVVLVSRIFAEHPFSDGVLHVVRVLQHLFQVGFRFLVRKPV